MTENTITDPLAFHKHLRESQRSGMLWITKSSNMG
jgi:hypothetical protein